MNHRPSGTVWEKDFFEYSRTVSGLYTYYDSWTWLSDSAAICGCSVIFLAYLTMWAGVAQSISRLATGWTVWGSNPGGGEIFLIRLDRPWGPPSLLYNGYWVFTGGKTAGAWRWPPTPSRAEVKERVVLYPYSPLWVFVACYRLNFKFWRCSTDSERTFNCNILLISYVHSLPLQTPIAKPFSFLKKGDLLLW
jgi:hypothetical protein